MKNTKRQKRVETQKTTKKEQQMIIKDIVPVRNEQGEATHINIILEDRTSLPVPNTKSALLHYRDIMLKQTREQKEQIKTTERAKNASIVMMIAGVAGVVLVNTTKFGQEAGGLATSIISGTISVVGGIGTVVNDKKLSVLQKNVTFAFHRDEINKVVCENPYVYQDVAPKDKKLIEMWLEAYRGEPIVIENLCMLEPKTIQQIWRNIKLYKQFNFEYKADGQIEEPAFQKIIMPDKKNEQCK